MGSCLLVSILQSWSESCCLYVSAEDGDVTNSVSVLCVFRFLSGKCTIYKLFGLCMVLLLVSLLWLQLSCSGDMSATLHEDRRPQQPPPPPPPPPCPADTQASALDDPSWGPHKLALIIPFRERFEELLVFVPFMHTFLNRKKIRHKIIVINQVDHFRWGRPTETFLTVFTLFHLYSFIVLTKAHLIYRTHKPLTTFRVCFCCSSYKELIFVSHQNTVYALVGFRYKNHLVRVRNTSWFYNIYMLQSSWSQVQSSWEK